ncbi:hypothetical protein MJO29_002566, partial [Puccinia striiformis f. sp. tritici]
LEEEPEEFSTKELKSPKEEGRIFVGNNKVNKFIDKFDCNKITYKPALGYTPKKSAIMDLSTQEFILDNPEDHSPVGATAANYPSEHMSLPPCTLGKIGEKKDLVNLDHEEEYFGPEILIIRPKNAGVLRKKAIEWKNAGTLSERKAIFKSFSVHYSVLYELPYFDPLSSALNSKGKQKVVQSELVEALLAPFQNLEIPLAVESEHVPDTADPEESKGESEDESEDDRDSEDEECSYALDCQIPTDSNPLGARFFGKGENLQILPEVNKEFQLPSWIGCVPSTVVAAKGGKLKADEW